jgi:hypothetical protein
MDEHHLGYACNLGFKTGQVNTGVETFVFWRAGWLLQVHHVQPRQPVVLRVGGFALPLADTTTHLEIDRPLGGSAGSTHRLHAFSSAGQGTVLQPLLGFAAAEWETRLDDSRERAHVAAPYHITPVVRTSRTSSSLVLAALVWSGADRAESASWAIDSAAAERWTLSHPRLGRWELAHWSLPALSVQSL